jgi:hypothetical protein
MSSSIALKPRRPAEPDAVTWLGGALVNIVICANSPKMQERRRDRSLAEPRTGSRSALYKRVHPRRTRRSSDDARPMPNRICLCYMGLTLMTNEDSYAIWCRLAKHCRACHGERRVRGPVRGAIANVTPRALRPALSSCNVEGPKRHAVGVSGCDMRPTSRVLP